MNLDLERNLILRTEWMVEGASRRAARDGEDVRLAISLTVVPGEEPGTFVPVMIIVLTMAAAVIGERIFSNLLSYDLDLTQDTVEKSVQAMIETMRAQRSELLSATTV